MSGVNRRNPFHRFIGLKQYFEEGQAHAKKSNKGAGQMKIDHISPVIPGVSIHKHG